METLWKVGYFGILEVSIIHSLPNVVTYMPVMLVGAELDGLKNSLANKEKEMVEIDQVINQLNTKIHQVSLIQSQAVYVLCPLCIHGINNKIQLN